MPIPVLAIRGNTDLPRVENLLHIYPNTASLHFKQIAKNGVLFTGIGGTIAIPLSLQICLRKKQALYKLESRINSTKILVFHTPP
jgi:Icc-related predicted phosphoesterase